MKSIVISFITFLFITKVHSQEPKSDNIKGRKNYMVGVYYFPNYHIDKRNENYFGKGWSEWKLVKEGSPKFKDLNSHQ